MSLQPDKDSNQGVEEPEEELTEDDLPRLQIEVDELQAQFDANVVEKHSLEMELISTKERLRAASEVIER